MIYGMGAAVASTDIFCMNEVAIFFSTVNGQFYMEKMCMKKRIFYRHAHFRKLPKHADGRPA